MSKEPLPEKLSFIATLAGRLDSIITSYLEEHFDLPLPSRSQIKKVISQGYVLVNGSVKSKAGNEVKPGDQLALSFEILGQTDLLPYDFPLDIVYEDDSLLVVDKPIGLQVHPGAGNQDKTLVNAVLNHLSSEPGEFEDPQRPGIVHRLDKDTTGLLVVAKNPAVHAELARQFAARSVRRSYRALTITTPRRRREVDTQSSGRIDLPIGRDPANKIKMAVVENSGKNAVTDWEVIERFGYGNLLKVVLKTGRTHQIRVHMAEIGAALVGDQLYGESIELPAALKRKIAEFGRQALHAAELGFGHPISGKQLLFESQLPRDFLELIEFVRSFGQGQ